MADVTFRQYTPDDGLPSSVATSIAEGYDGFLWIGTQGGLVRWDGYRTRLYWSNPADPGALQDSVVTALHTDPLGRLWVGASSGGLARYDRINDRFVTYRAGPQGLSNVHVTTIADADGGRLWVGTDDGLDELDPETGRIVVYRTTPRDLNGLPSNRVLALLRDRAGTLWIGTDKGLVRRRPGGRRFETVPIIGDASGDMEISSLFQDETGGVWIGSKKHGAFVIQPADSKPRPVLGTDDASHDLKSEWVYAIGAGPPGEVWLGMSGQGIVAVEVATGRTRRILHDPTKPRSLGSDTIWCLYKDRAGGVWVGSDNSLSQLEMNGGALTVISGDAGHAGLRESDVGALMAASDGRVWAGLSTKGIDILDPALGSVAHISSDRTKPDTALPESYILAMLQWSKDRVYIGGGAGLYQADASGGHVALIKLPGRVPTARTYALEPVGGELWVGGADDGLWAFKPGNEAPAVEHFGADRLTDQRIIALVSDAAGGLWIGTRNGLNRLDLASRKVERISAQPTDATALSGGFITSLLLDRAGRLWAGTQGSGVDILVGRRAGRPVFRHIGIAQGLPNEDVSSLLSDARGRIWAYTEGGVAIVDPATFAVQTLGRADGVPSSSPWNHAAVALPTGELLFGTAGASGITVIRPDRLRAWTYRPPIVVTDARIGGKAFPANRLNGGGGDDALRIQPGANSLAVEFSALDYSAPTKNRYAYRLEGFDKTWIETDATRRLATYTNLPPGDYVLHLRGSNRNGVWSQRGLHLPIHVSPAWYQTLWFYVLATLGGLACILAVVHGRTRYLRAQKLELERQIAERTVQLETALAAAEAANVSKSTFLATMSHEIRTPLNGVLGMVQAMSVEDRLGVHKEKLDIIRQSGNSLLTILNDVLDMSKIEAGKLDIEEIEFDLHSVVQSAQAAFSSISEKKNLSFAMQVAAAAGVYLGDPVRIRQILYNLISNALKFTEVGGISIMGDYVEGELRLSVRDSGMGMSPEVLGRLFEKFVQADSSTTRNFGGTGLGLSISRQLAEIMGGALKVESVAGSGSTFTLVLPLRRLRDEDDAVAEPGDGSPNAAPDLQLRVLAAEDNEINQIVLKTLLNQVGIEPILVGNGRLAVAAWEQGAFDLILMDVQMPEMDGPTAARTIRREEARTGRPHTPIIALTANAMAHHVAEYLASGMDGHVAKPIEAQKLYAALETALSEFDGPGMEALPG